jgi:hypothetical protein
MDYNFNDPFGYAWTEYAFTILLASVGGLIKFLNGDQLKLRPLIVTVLTAGYTGLLTFWFCKMMSIQGPLMAILISIGGMMGNRTWSEFENFYRKRLGLTKDEEGK